MNGIRVIWQYFVNWAHLLDQALNTALGGDPRMTLSARMGRDIARGRCVLCRPVCGLLNLIQRDHCARAWAGDSTPVNASMQVTKD